MCKIYYSETSLVYICMLFGLIIVSLQMKFITNAKTNWLPSIHRFGKVFDHSLIQVDWKWRVKAEKATAAKDFKAMQQED